MRDTCKPLRKAIYDVLNGAVSVTVNGTPMTIPVYDGKVWDPQAPGYYIIFGGQREQNIPDTDCTWKTQSSIDVIIIARTASEATKDSVDDISAVVLDLLIGLPGIGHYAQQSGLSIDELRRESATIQNIAITATDTYIQKTLTLVAIVTQLN